MKFNPKQEYVATAKRNQDFICIDAYCRHGLSILDPYEGKQILLPLDVSNQKLGESVLEVLAASRTITEEESLARFKREDLAVMYKKWVTDLMEKQGYKTKQTLFRKMMNCDVVCYQGNIEITPTRHEKLEAWSGSEIAASGKVNLPVSSLAEEIGAGLQLAFSHCW